MQFEAKFRQKQEEKMSWEKLKKKENTHCKSLTLFYSTIDAEQTHLNCSLEKLIRL